MRINSFTSTFLLWVWRMACTTLGTSLRVRGLRSGCDLVVNKFQGQM